MGQKWRQIISPTRKRHGHDTDTTLTRLSPQFGLGPTRTRHGPDTDTRSKCQYFLWAPLQIIERHFTADRSGVESGGAPPSFVSRFAKTCLTQ